MCLPCTSSRASVTYGQSAMRVEGVGRKLAWRTEILQLLPPPPMPILISMPPVLLVDEAIGPEEVALGMVMAIEEVIDIAVMEDIVDTSIVAAMLCGIKLMKSRWKTVDLRNKRLSGKR